MIYSYVFGGLILVCLALWAWLSMDEQKQVKIDRSAIRTLLERSADVERRLKDLELEHEVARGDQ